MALSGLVFGAVLLLVVAGEWLGFLEVASRRVPFPVGVILVALLRAHRPWWRSRTV